MEFLQGGAVDLGSYYETQVRRLERLKKVAPDIGLRQQNTIRNVSQISFGDSYYYSGRHMFSTTSKESYGPESLTVAGRHGTAQSVSSPFSFNSSSRSEPSVSSHPLSIIATTRPPSHQASRRRAERTARSSTTTASSPRPSSAAIACTSSGWRWGSASGRAPSRATATSPTSSAPSQRPTSATRASSGPRSFTVRRPPPPPMPPSAAGRAHCRRAAGRRPPRRAAEQ